MMRLVQQSDKNSPQEYDRIYKERQEKGVDEHDLRRWKRLLKHYRGGRILDAGCLDSQILPMAWTKLYFTTGIGIDLADKAIRDSEITNSFPGVFYMYGDVYETTFENGYFDYIVLGEVLEHLNEPWEAVKEAVRVLKKGGTLAISVPLEEAREPGACDGDRHIWSFDKADMENMLSPYGEVEFETVGSLFTWKPPFYRYHWKSLLTFCKKSCK